MWILLGLLCIPIVFAVGTYYLGGPRITREEAVIQMGVMLAVVITGFYLGKWAGLQDHEIWNGRVADKDSGTHGCCHSYDCNCREECSTDSDGHSTCTRVCDTCYEHSYDRYWNAVSTNKETIYSNNCNPPSTPTPSTWLNIRIGEPTAVEHRFTNYIKAAPHRFFNVEAIAEVDGQLPRYPPVRGWRAQRFIKLGLPADKWDLNNALAELNADLGALKQVNVIVVVTAEKQRRYFDALSAHWLGGKKNDVVLVIGAPEYPRIAWADVMAWNTSEGAENEFKAALRARVEALGELGGNGLIDVLREEISTRYQRRPMSEMRHLFAEATLPTWALISLIVVALGGSLALGAVFWRNERKRGWRPKPRPRGWPLPTPRPPRRRRRPKPSQPVERV